MTDKDIRDKITKFLCDKKYITDDYNTADSAFIHTAVHMTQELIQHLELNEVNKKNKISDLQDHIDDLKDNNEGLKTTNRDLVEEIDELSDKVLEYEEASEPKYNRIDHLVDKGQLNVNEVDYLIDQIVEHKEIQPAIDSLKKPIYDRKLVNT